VIHWFYRPGYDYGSGIPLMPKRVHGFVRDKPSRIKNHLVEAGAVRDGDIRSAEAVTLADVSTVHTDAVVAGLERSADIAVAVELAPLRYVPSVLSRKLVVAPQLRAAGGTCAALAAAAQGDWAFNLSGGFHHARPDLSHGFCLINDVAIAVHRLRETGWAGRLAVVDLDLHQGDGNAAMFADDEAVFTASLHQQSAFPYPKLDSDYDEGLADHTTDAPYLEAVDRTLDATKAHAPDIVVYVAGTDPFERDDIGSLRVTRSGMIERDTRVAQWCRANGAALIALPAGGYSEESPEISAAGFAAMARVLSSP
jgi:acetoin utilization deacetylase AcuC-like enzyme